MSEIDTLERIVPNALNEGDVTGRATLALHLERYHWAAAQLPVGLTLDLACGVGYGSVILAERHHEVKVIAADLSRSALRRAMTEYGHPRVHLICGDGATWTRQAAFQAIVSLETLEHVPDPEAMLRDLVRSLAVTGMLVVSVPVTPSVDANPHHMTDFTEESIMALGTSLGLAPVARMRQVQRFAPWSVLTRSEKRAQDLRRDLLGYYLRNPGAAWKRFTTTLRHGFANHYLTVAWVHVTQEGSP